MLVYLKEIERHRLSIMPDLKQKINIHNNTNDN